MCGPTPPRPTPLVPTVPVCSPSVRVVIVLGGDAGPVSSASWSGLSGLPAWGWTHTCVMTVLLVLLVRVVVAVVVIAFLVLAFDLVRSKWAMRGSESEYRRARRAGEKRDREFLEWVREVRAHPEGRSAGDLWKAFPEDRRYGTFNEGTPWSRIHRSSYEMQLNKYDGAFAIGHASDEDTEVVRTGLKVVLGEGVFVLTVLHRGVWDDGERLDTGEWMPYWKPGKWFDDTTFKPVLVPYDATPDELRKAISDLETRVDRRYAKHAENGDK